MEKKLKTIEELRIQIEKNPKETIIEIMDDDYYLTDEIKELLFKYRPVLYEINDDIKNQSWMGLDEKREE